MKQRDYIVVWANILDRNVRHANVVRLEDGPEHEFEDRIKTALHRELPEGFERDCLGIIFIAELPEAQTHSPPLKIVLDGWPTELASVPHGNSVNLWELEP